MFPEISYRCMRFQPEVFEADFDRDRALFSVKQSNRSAAVMKRFHPDLHGADLQHAAGLRPETILIDGDGFRVRDDGQA